VTDVGSRMARQLEYVPDPGRDLFSAEAHEYVDAVPGLQEAAASEATLNGEDSQRRLRVPSE
jgi:hypothetical protein